MILTPDLMEIIKKRLGNLKGPVKFVVFNSEAEGEHGKHIEQFAKEVAALSPKFSFESYSIENNADRAKAYKVDIAPAIILENKEGKQARFFGLPAGEEFTVFLSDIADLSHGNTSIPHDIIHKAQEISTPMHLQVFVSSTCPYCPGMVKLAHGMAMSNPHIQADMIRVEEFRALADKYNIMSVPKTIVNGKNALEGYMPSDMFVRKLKELEKK